MNVMLSNAYWRAAFSSWRRARSSASWSARAAGQTDRALLEHRLQVRVEGRDFLGDRGAVFRSPGRGTLAEGHALKLGQRDGSAGAHLEERARGEGLDRHDASAALHGDLAELTGVPAGIGGLARGREETERDPGGGLGGAAAEEAQQGQAEVPDEAQGHQRDGHIGDEPARIPDDLEDGLVFALLGAAEARLEEGQAGMAQRLVHGDVEREGAGAFHERHVAREAAGGLGSGVFLVRELIEPDGERHVMTDAAEGHLVGLPGLRERLRVE